MPIIKRHPIMTGLLALLAACQGSPDSAPSNSGNNEAVGVERAGKYLYSVTFDDGLSLADDTDDEQSPNKAKDKPSKAEIHACSAYFRSDATAVKVAGHNKNIELAPTDLLAVRITGKHNQVKVTIKALAEGTDTATTTSTTTSTETTISSDSETEQNALADTQEADPEQSTPRAPESEYDTAQSESDTVRALPELFGICFFLAGREPTAKVAIQGFKLGQFGFITRGKGATGEIDIAADASVGNFLLDIGRNGGGLTISGEGEFTCPTDHGVDCTN